VPCLPREALDSKYAGWAEGEARAVICPRNVIRGWGLLQRKLTDEAIPLVSIC